jgi:hypothetical protein
MKLLAFFFKKTLFCPAILGNKGESKTGVSAEPELEGDVESSGLSGSETSTSELDGVTNHVVVTNLKTRLERELIPDVEPFTVVAIALERVTFYSYRS